MVHVSSKLALAVLTVAPAALASAIAYDATDYDARDFAEEHFEARGPALEKLKAAGRKIQTAAGKAVNAADKGSQALGHASNLLSVVSGNGAPAVPATPGMGMVMRDLEVDIDDLEARNRLAGLKKVGGVLGKALGHVGNVAMIGSMFGGMSARELADLEEELAARDIDIEDLIAVRDFEDLDARNRLAGLKKVGSVVGKALGHVGNVAMIGSMFGGMGARELDELELALEARGKNGHGKGKGKKRHGKKRHHKKKHGRKHRKGQGKGKKDAAAADSSAPPADASGSPGGADSDAGVGAGAEGLSAEAPPMKRRLSERDFMLDEELEELQAREEFFDGLWLD